MPPFFWIHFYCALLNTHVNGSVAILTNDTTVTTQSSTAVARFEETIPDVEAAPPAEVVATIAPPPPQVEVQPPPPAPNQVWIRGHWFWAGTRWAWAPGLYINERPGYEWVQPMQVQRGPSFVYVGGYWRVPEVVIQTAPPAPEIEIIPPAPSPMHFWIGGHWGWAGSRWAWAPGYYDVRREGYVYQPPIYERRGPRYVYVGGHWQGPPAPGPRAVYIEPRRRIPVGYPGVRRIYEPRERVVEPRERVVVEPRERVVVEPRERVVEPRERVVEPRERVVEPRERVVEPRERVVEPRERVVEPRERVVEPRERVVEPRERVVEPRRAPPPPPVHRGPPPGNPHHR